MPRPTRIFPILLGLCLALPVCAAAPPAYPVTEKSEVADTSFGVVVPDPYRWLEQDVRSAPAVRAWVEAENKVTQDYLATLPRRAEIKARLVELWNFEKFRVPERQGGRYFYAHNSGLQNQFTLMVQDGLNGTPRLILDPNSWSQDGATALAEWSPSHDGRKLVYAVQDGGTDWRIVRVIDVDTMAALPDELHWVKSSRLAWARDGSGFFYSRFPEPKAGAEFQATNLDQAVYFHKLGEPQSADRLIYRTPERPKLQHDAEVTEDGRYLVITSPEGTDARGQLTVIDLKDKKLKPRRLVEGFEDSYDLAGSIGSHLFFVTDNKAPNYRLVMIDLGDQGPLQLHEIVPEGKSTLASAHYLGGRFVVNTIEDAKSVVRIVDRTGKALSTLALPGIGSATGFQGDGNDPETFFAFSSYNTAPTLYRLDTRTGIAAAITGGH